MHRSLIFLWMILLCSCSLNTREESHYKPDWESLKEYSVPDWFRDAKFGIYFHWGIYSVPAYLTEWYSHRMYEPGTRVHQYHVSHFGPVSNFGYKDFIPRFKPDKFDADEWVRLFKKAGARFAGPVAEHADGFAMWDSELTRFDAMEMGPMRDIVGEMEMAVKNHDMKFITTFHHQWLYGWYPTWDEASGTADPAYSDLYGPVVPSSAWKPSGEDPDPMPDEAFCDRWLSRVVEVIDKYRPDLVWFDSKLHIIDEQYRLDMLSYYYNRALDWGKDVVVTYKHKDLKPWAGVLDLERARMKEKKAFPWLTDDSVDWGSWCDVQDPDYKSANRMIDFLVDVVSKNGCVLLNVTPTAAGEIPAPVQERLLEIGKWLDLNGEAIYDTRPWQVYGEGPTEIVEGHLNEIENPDHTAEDIRFTCKGDTVYAIFLDIPEPTALTVRSLCPENGIAAEKIKDISLLGSDQSLSWSEEEEGLMIRLQQRPELEHAMAFRIILK